MTRLSFETLKILRQNHPAWRLLASDNAEMVASFLYKIFLSDRVHGVAHLDLVSRLDDYLFSLNLQTEGDYKQTAEGYLALWCSETSAWLRKYYPAGSDEAHYDLTPATEKALTWLETLGQDAFVGTESRLLTIFELLRQLVAGGSDDPEVRLAELRRRRDELDREIDQVQAGAQPLVDEVKARDRFQQAARMARELLSDFRQVEENFRVLDRQTREQIARWEGTKGELLAAILGQREAISDSDQGRSFRSFWDFLMDPRRQDELGRLWETAVNLPAIRGLDIDPRLKRIHFDWLGAGGHTQRTVALLSAQLRRFLDDRVWWENRRIAQLIQQIEIGALAVRDALPSGAFFEMDALSAVFDTPMERPLFSPPFRADLSGEVEAGVGSEIDASLLFDQILVDTGRLEQWLEAELDQSAQTTLGRLVEDHPPEHGLAEIMAWLGVASERPGTVFDDEHIETLSWELDQRKRRAVGSRVILTRKQGPHGE